MLHERWRTFDRRHHVRVRAIDSKVLRRTAGVGGAVAFGMVIVSAVRHDWGAEAFFMSLVLIASNVTWWQDYQRERMRWATEHMAMLEERSKREALERGVDNYLDWLAAAEEEKRGGSAA